MASSAKRSRRTKYSVVGVLEFVRMLAKRRVNTKLGIH